jgi:hypothetical protein
MLLLAKKQDANSLKSYYRFFVQIKEKSLKTDLSLAKHFILPLMIHSIF